VTQRAAAQVELALAEMEVMSSTTAKLNELRHATGGGVPAMEDFARLIGREP
jgi:hypothetical protein